MTNLTRKDIARLLNVSTKQVERNEERWGLRSVRITMNRKCIRYTAAAIALLKRKGWLS